MQKAQEGFTVEGSLCVKGFGAAAVAGYGYKKEADKVVSPGLLLDNRREEVALMVTFEVKQHERTTGRKWYYHFCNNIRQFLARCSINIPHSANTQLVACKPWQYWNSN